jgi:myo-inositol-1(or 4)-monophosphatase
MTSYLQIAMEAAREGGAILMAEYARPAQISYKSDVDIVTQADRRSEAAVVARLQSSFPRHTIVAEEGTGHEEGRALCPGEFRWYVDPLDGTTNFAHKYPCFAVSIGLAQRATDGSDGEELLAGVVLNPVSGEMFTAEKGGGAWLNQKAIRVSSVERLATSLVATGFPPANRREGRNIHYYGQFTLCSHGVRRDGSAALDLCAVACGRFDGFWEFGLKPWDTAAGVLILREAGGMVTDLGGRPYRLGGTSLLASNARIHAEMQRVAADVAERFVPPSDGR